MYRFHVDANLASSIFFYLNRHVKCPVSWSFILSGTDSIQEPSLFFLGRKQVLLHTLCISSFRTPSASLSLAESCLGVFSRLLRMPSTEGNTHDYFNVSVETAGVSSPVWMTFLEAEIRVGEGRPPVCLPQHLFPWLAVSASFNSCAS